MTFVNFSNHHTRDEENPWKPNQIEASRVYGEIIELPFPAVPAESNEETVTRMAEDYAEQIMKLKPDCVMCQGEFTLTYKIVSMLKQNGIRVVAACSERDTVKVGKNFTFVRYREY